MIAGTLEIQLLANMARLSADMNSAKSIVGTSMKSIESSVKQARAAMASLVGAIGIGFGVRELISLADGYTKYTSQLKLATSSQAEFDTALATVSDIATKAQGDLEGVGTLYARITNATREMGLNQKEVSNITETVALALKASGATAQESASAMLQLSQAFGSGKLRGEEFNAVNEAAPRLMRALAEGMGEPVGKLRELATEGKITSEVMAKALPRSLEILREEAKQVQTISGAFTVLKNKVMEFVGVQAQASGVVMGVTRAITLLAENLNILAIALIGVTTTKFLNWIVSATKEIYVKIAAQVSAIATTAAERNAILAKTAAEIAEAESTLAFITAERARTVAELASTQATIAATAAIGAQSGALAANTVAKAANAAAITNLANLGKMQATATAALTAAQGAQTAAMAASGAAAVGLRAAIGFLGGPIGAIITVLGLAATAWSVFGSSAKDANEKAEQSLLQSTDSILMGLDKQIEKLKEKKILLMSGPDAADLAKAGGPDAQFAAATLKKIKEIQAKPGGLTPDDQAQVSALAVAYNRVIEKQKEKKALDEDTTELMQRKSLAQYMDEYATKAQKADKEIAKVKKELGANFTPELERLMRLKLDPKTAKSGGSSDPFLSMKKQLEEKLVLDAELTHSAQLQRDIAAMSAKDQAKLSPLRLAELADIAKKIDLREAEVAAEKAAAARRQNELEDFKSIQSHRQQMLEVDREAGRVSDESYFAQRVVMAKQASEKEIDIINRTIAAEQEKLSRLEAGSKAYYEQLILVEGAESKRERTLREFGQTAEIIWAQAAKAALEYKNAIEDIDTEIMNLQGRTAEAAMRQFDRSKDALRKRAVASGDTEAVGKIDELRKLVGAQAEFNEARQKLSDINAWTSISEERIQNSLKVGAISELEALQRTSDARQKAVMEQEAIVANLRRIAEESQNPALQLQAEQATLALEKLRAESNLVAQKFESIFVGSATDALNDFIDGSKNAKEAFRSFGDSVVKQINRMVTEALSKRLFNALGLGGGAQGEGIGGIFDQIFRGVLGQPKVAKPPATPTPGAPAGLPPGDTGILGGGIFGVLGGLFTGGAAGRGGAAQSSPDLVKYFMASAEEGCFGGMKSAFELSESPIMKLFSGSSDSGVAAGIEAATSKGGIFNLVSGLFSSASSSGVSSGLGSIFSGGGGGMFGGGGGGAGGLFDSFGIGNMFGGGGAAGGGFGGFLGDIFGGMAMFDQGTNYVPRTGLAILHEGEAVVPASQNRGSESSSASRPIQVTNVFHISGNVDQRSQSQIAAASGEGVRRALARNT